MTSRNKYEKWYYTINNEIKNDMHYKNESIGNENKILSNISKRLCSKNAKYDVGILF